MDDDGSLLLTIGQLASRTGLAVRTIRYWSGIGAVPPAGRSSGGHRLYNAESVARLELVATLRELGLGLDEVRRVLAREDTAADVAAAHVAALDAQTRSLRLTRAVLSAVARRAVQGDGDADADAPVAAAGQGRHSQGGCPVEGGERVRAVAAAA